VELVGQYGVVCALFIDALHIFGAYVFSRVEIAMTLIVNVADGLLTDGLISEDAQIAIIQDLGPDVTKARHRINICVVNVHRN